MLYWILGYIAYVALAVTGLVWFVDLITDHES